MEKTMPAYPANKHRSRNILIALREQYFPAP
jgi:hypothetical protein